MRVYVGRTALFISRALSMMKQRVTALFFVTIILFGAGSQTAFAIAATTTGSHSPDIPTSVTKPHTSTTPSTGSINYNSASAPQTLQSKLPAASDAKPADYGAATTSLFDKTANRLNSPAMQPATGLQPQSITPHELTNSRTATSSLYLNKDGSVTKTDYFTPHFYQNNNSWDTIDTSLVPDDNAADSGNVFGEALGTVESWMTSTPTAFIEKANSWQARFTPSNFSLGMVRIKQGDSQIGFSPINANAVNPVITTDSSGVQTVHYYNLWNGVDVNYQVESDKVSEAIVLKDKTAASQVQFKMIGGDLQKPSGDNTKQLLPAFNITGALNNQFSIAPASLILNSFGPIDDNTAGLTQGYANGTYTVGISNSYLQSLPAKAFPAVIDPDVENFGTRQGGAGSNYESFETTGYNCPSTICDLYAGAVTASDGSLQYWRGALYVSYDQFNPSGENESLQDAVLHLSQRTGVSWNTGSTATFNYNVGNATCLTGYNCWDSAWDSANIGTSGDIDVTNIYKNLIQNNNWGGWLMLDAQDGTQMSWKAFDPANSYVTFTYNNPLPSPTFAVPQANQVFVDPQASFSLNSESNPNNSTPLEYGMQITSGSDGSGTVIDSGSFQQSPDWTVPDGVLQDGATYYIEGATYDPSTNLESSWSAPVPFRIDTREGQDTTQTYDTLGPVNVDLATGNVETSASSHTTTALGGNIGVNLDYNSPLKSRSGLIGSYWNQSGSGSASDPDLQRVDQNVNFDWNGGTPGAPINTTDFNTQWNGYFVAPTTGSYTFGGTNYGSMSISVNNQQVYNSSGCSYSSGPCFGTSVSLTAGQVVPFQAAYSQATGADYAHVEVEGAVPVQVVPDSWFQTGVRQTQQAQGLLGKYYTYTDNGNPPTFPSDGTDGLFLTRTDPVMNFNWDNSSPVSNGPTTDFMVQWTGYITIPVAGTYTFGTNSDDGSSVTINGQSVFSKWQDSSGGNAYGSGIPYTPGTYPITVDYYQHLGSASMALLVEPPSGSSEVVPSNWLTPPQAQVLPAGWSLGSNLDGDISYTHLTADQGNAVLSDASGDTYDYVWNGTGYTPPANAYGNLVRNNDGTFTLQDSDGKTYVFDTSGNLTSVTSPVDDQNPAALQYTYGPINGTGPVVLQRITDGVNSNRYMQLYYSGASQCGSIPSGFYLAPTNMLCAAQTNDGRTTYFYYDQYGNLAEVSEPGNEDTTYQYQAVLNASSSVIGYQLAGIRDPLANDTVVAGERANDETTYSQIGYDVLGRAISVTEPAATASASQVENTVDYYSGATEEHVVGATEPVGYSKRVEYDNLFRTTKVYDNQGLATTMTWDPVKDLLYSTTSPEGTMTTTVYDDEDRPVTSYGPAPASWFNTWSWTLPNDTSLSEGQGLWSPDHRFNLVFQTDGNVVLYGPNGVMWASNTGGETATALVMQTDGNLVEYNDNTPIWASNTGGSGPTTYVAIQNDGSVILYNASRPVWESNTGGWEPSPTPSTYGTPQSSYTSQVARSDVAYDQGMTGLNVAYMQADEPGTNNATLSGTPLLNSLNIANDGTMSHDWGSTPPVSTQNSDWGFSMTGTMRLPTTGNWTFQLGSDEGMRMWINNQLVINDWTDNTTGNATRSDTYTYDNTLANSVQYVRIDYYHMHTSSDANFSLLVTPPGGSQTSQVATYFSPNYGLATSTTSYDATYGNSTVNVGYGSDPDLGLATTATIDPTGLDQTGASTYESAGTGYNRLTAQTSPGGSTTSYTYYGANDTAANPCVSGSTAAYQAGMLKTVTDSSPNGGTTPGIATTTVYDNAGNIVATQTNSDGWECKTYDARGRLIEDVTPAFNGNPSRTVTYNYDVGGNPLVTSVTDSNGTITTTTDMLGRTVSYADDNGDTTTTAYDNLGRVSSETNPEGTFTYVYDTYNRPTDEKLNGNDLAWLTYDQYGRLSTVSYPQAAALNTTMSYDAVTGAQTSQAYNLSGSTPGANLFSNPSLEQSTGGQPNNWSTNNWGTNTASFSYLTNDGYNSSSSVEVNMSSYTSGDAKWQPNAVNITGGDTYTFQDYFKSNAQTTVDVEYTNQDGSNTYQWLGSPNASGNNWAQASYTFTAPSTAVKATILHLISSVGYLQLDDMSLQQNQTPVSVSDTDTLTQSGKVQQDTVSNGSSNLSSTYTYNAADELTAATVGSNTYSYGFGTQNSSCGTASNMNPNAGMNGNRTSQTINGATTTYCYNYADQLVSSSDPTANGDEYDSHGNLTQIGTGSAPVQFQYDSSDRPEGMQQFTSSGNGMGIYDSRDALGRIISRTENTITNWSWNDTGDYHYFYSGDGDSPSYVRNDSWQIIEEYVSLPGGVTETIYPQKTGSSQSSYNLSNLQGDTFLTTDATGTNTSTGNGPSSSFIYDPFGNPISGSSDPVNTDSASFGYEGSDLKFTETDITLLPIQMGARIYLPTLGRFTSMDPIPGGNANAYVYILDPINGSDTSGESANIPLGSGSLQNAASVYLLQPALVVAQQSLLHSSISNVRMSSSAGEVIVVRSSTATAKAQAPANQDVVRYTELAELPAGATAPPLGTAPVLPGNNTGGAGSDFDYYSAVSTASDFYAGGEIVGGGLGCGAGAVIGGIAGFLAAGIGALPGAGAGCVVFGEVGASAGAPIGAVVGWLVGGYDAYGSESFSWGPDHTKPYPWEQ